MLFLIFTFNVVSVDEHLLKRMWVTGIIELLQQLLHVLHFLEPMVTQDLVFVQLSKLRLVDILLLVLHIQAALLNVLAFKLLDLLHSLQL